MNEKDAIEIIKRAYEDARGSIFFRDELQAIDVLEEYVKNSIDKNKINNKINKKIKEYQYLEEENIKNKDNMDYEECFNKEYLYTRIIWLLNELLEEE